MLRRTAPPLWICTAAQTAPYTRPNRTAATDTHSIPNNKNIHFFAIAALAATLMVGQVQTSPVYAEDKSVQLGSLIPDNVTIEEPVPLSDISLPDSKYGTLTWADSSSVPSERVQSYDVVFKPYDSSVLSRISGWDGESDAIYSSVTVVVNSIASDSEEEWKEDST